MTFYWSIQYSCNSLHLLASKCIENSLYGNMPHIEIGKMNKAPFIDMNNAVKHELMFNLVSYFITRNSLSLPCINRYSVIRLSIYEHSLSNCAYIFTCMSSVYMDQQLRVLDDLRTSYNWENSSNVYLLLHVFRYHTKETALVIKNFRV